MVASKDKTDDSKHDKPQENHVASPSEALSRLQESIWGPQRDAGKDSSRRDSSGAEKGAGQGDQKNGLPSLSIIDGGKKSGEEDDSAPGHSKKVADKKREGTDPKHPGVDQKHVGADQKHPAAD